MRAIFFNSLFYLAILIHCQPSQGIKIAREPVNSAFPDRTIGRLNCTVDDPSQFHRLTWLFYPLEAGAQESIVMIGSTGGDQTVHDSTNFDVFPLSKHDLKIKTTSPQLAGRYVCELLFDDSSIPPKTSVEVVTMGTMNCPASDETVDEDTHVNLECSVPYSGNKVPRLEWYRDGLRLPDGEYLTDAQNPDPAPPGWQTLRYRSNVTITYEDDMAAFQCRVYFESEDQIDYVDMCTTQYQVTYGVTDIAISPTPDEFPNDEIKLEVGDVINCTARGRPEPYFQWKKLEGTGLKDINPGAQLKLTTDMIGLNNRYECMASNEPRGQEREAKKVVEFALELGDNGASGLTSSGLAIIIAFYLFA